MRWSDIVKATAGMILISIMIILPWSIRNYAVSHYIVPIATGGSTILAGAYNDTVFTNPFLGATGTWVPPGLAKPPIEYTQKSCTIFGEEPNQQAYALHWIRTHLKSMPRLLALHFINIWRPITPDGALPISQFPDRLISKIIKFSLRVAPLFIFAFAALGLVATWKRKWKQFLTLYLAIGLTVVQCIALYGSVRFRAPIEPMLVLLAVAGLWWLAQLWQSKVAVPVSKEPLPLAAHDLDMTRPGTR